MKMILIILAVFLSGCTTVRDYFDRPILEDRIKNDGGFTIVSTKASRRANFVANLNEPNGNGFRFICVEPQPDVGEDISNALKASLDAEVSPENAVKAALAYGNVFTLLSKHFDRSVVIEFLRTNIFALCQHQYNSFVRAVKACEISEDPEDCDLTVYKGYEANDFKEIANQAYVIALAEVIANSSTPTGTELNADAKVLENANKETLKKLEGLIGKPPAPKKDENIYSILKKIEELVKGKEDA